MNRRIETQIRKIETDLSNSLNLLPKPASEYTVKHLIRDRVLQVHRLGAEYACRHFGLKHFNTAHDFAEIGKISDDVYRVFTYARNQEAALIALTSITLAKAVKAKAKQISQAIRSNDLDNMLEVDTNNLAVVMTAQTDITDTSTTDTTTTTIDLFIWKTEEDDLVCPECDALADQTWEIDDPTIPTPVSDTHPNCRCRLELITEDIVNPD